MDGYTPLEESGLDTLPPGALSMLDRLADLICADVTDFDIVRQSFENDRV